MHLNFVHARSCPQRWVYGRKFWSEMMSLASRSGVIFPYLQATKQTVKCQLFSGAKELVPAAGKAEKRTLASY